MIQGWTNTIAGSRTSLSKGVGALACVCALLCFMPVTAVAAPKKIPEIPLPEIPNFPRAGHYCMIMLSGAGSLGVSYDSTQMGSKQPGGRSGTALVEATRSSYRLSLDTPASFSSSPPGGNDGTDFKTSFSGNGSTNFSERPGTRKVKLKKGKSRISTHFYASKTAETFPAGNYTAELTLRCE